MSKEQIPEEHQAQLDGHVVDARELDKFYNSNDGSRVTDEQWDESRDRTKAIDNGEIVLEDLGFDYIGTSLPEGDELAEAETE